MPSSLSQADVERLLASPSPRVRAEVAGKLGRDIDDPALTPAELSVAQDVIRLMARDAEVMVRAAVAQSLRGAARLPRDVALLLAEDVEAVALPVLTDSLVLTDEDLIAIARAGSGAKQAAIAGRATLAPQVADTLAGCGGEAAVAVLMRNEGARISEAGLTQALDRFRSSQAVTEGMARRAVLPATIAERLVALVSDRLRQYLVTHHHLPRELAADIVLQSRERATLRLSDGLTEADLRAMVVQMHRDGRLTPTLLLRALCIGDMEFFEAAVAAMASVPLANARLLIHDVGRTGFASVYRKAGLPAELFAAFRAAADVIDGTRYDGGARDMERFRARVISRILTQFDDFDDANLDYLVGKLGDALAPA